MMVVAVVVIIDVVQDIADETWLKYMMRNQSIVVRLFQGQLKSRLVCPLCSKVNPIIKG